MVMSAYIRMTCFAVFAPAQAAKAMKEQFDLSRLRPCSLNSQIWSLSETMRSASSGLMAMRAAYIPTPTCARFVIAAAVVHRDAPMTNSRGCSAVLAHRERGPVCLLLTEPQNL